MKISRYKHDSLYGWEFGLVLDFNKNSASPCHEYTCSLALRFYLFKKEYTVILQFKKNREFNPEIISKLVKKTKKEVKDYE